MNKKKFTYISLLFMLCLVNVGFYIAKAQEQNNDPLLSKGLGLSLNECIRLAMENSFEVRLAKLDLLIAETGQSRAEAIFDTTLSANIDYEDDKTQPSSSLGTTHTTTNTYSADLAKVLPSGTELTLSLSDTREWSDSVYALYNPAHTAEAGLEIRQPLGKNFFGYIDRRNISVTSLAIQNADLDTKEKIEQLIADVKTAYWEWAFGKKSLEIHRDILEKAKRLHKRNGQNYDIGLIEKGDLLASQANVLIREKDVLIADNKYKHAQEKIKLLMNTEAARLLYPQENLQYKKVKVNLEDCLHKAFEERRDYQKAKRELEMKDIILQTKSNELWPEIDLVASLDANGIDSEFNQAMESLTGDDNIKYAAGIEFSIPLENRLAQSDFKKAGYDKEKAIISLKNIERTIITEIGNAYRDYTTYEVNAAQLAQVAKLQQEKLNEEEKRFGYGRSNTKRLIDYQQDYLNAQLQLAQGILNLEEAKVNLEKTLNIILKKYEAML